MEVACSGLCRFRLRGEHQRHHPAAQLPDAYFHVGVGGIGIHELQMDILRSCSDDSVDRRGHRTLYQPHEIQAELAVRCCWIFAERTLSEPSRRMKPYFEL